MEDVSYYSAEKDSYLQKLKCSLYSDHNQHVLDEYRSLADEWSGSFSLGSPESIPSFDDTYRDFAVFQHVSYLTKYKLAYLDEFNTGREQVLDMLGAVIFYLDNDLSAFRVAGNIRLKEELKQKGLRHGSCFKSSLIGTFVANLAYEKPGEVFCRIGEENYFSVFTDYVCFAYYEEEKLRDFKGVNLIILPKEDYTYHHKILLNFIFHVLDITNMIAYPFITDQYHLLKDVEYSSKDMIMLIDRNCNVVFTSEAFEKNFGRRVPKGRYPHISMFMSELLFVQQYLTGKVKHTTRELHLTDVGDVNRKYIIDFTYLESQGLKCTFRIAEKSVPAQAKHYGQKPVYTFDSIIGQSIKIIELKQLANQIAQTNSNVLIYGESGTGKELVAQSIHTASAMKQGNFIPVNCAAMPAELFQSELFGYEEGAFTGARKGGAPGKFEQANNGTIFLDEISEMPLNMQSALLRILEDRVVSRVGGSRYIPLNTRVIAATNKDLWQCVQNGTFRADVYFRLNVAKIIIPPLRERKDDMELLMYHMLDRFSKNGISNVTAFSPEVVDLFQDYSWPGNIRELRNILERCTNTCRNQMLTLEDIPTDVLQTMRGHVITKPAHQLSVTKDIPSSTNWKTIDQQQIISLMIQYRGNKTKVAKVLGISRGTLYRKLSEYGLDTDGDDSLLP